MTPRHADTCPPCARMRAGAADEVPAGVIRSSHPLTLEEAVALREAAARHWPGRPPRLELQIAHARRRTLGGRLTWALMGLLLRRER